MKEKPEAVWLRVFYIKNTNDFSERFIISKILVH